MVSPDCDKEMKMELEGEDVGEKVHRKFVNLENQKTGMQFSLRQVSDFPRGDSFDLLVNGLIWVVFDT